MKKLCMFLLLFAAFLTGCSDAAVVKLTQDDILVDGYEGVKTLPVVWMTNAVFSAGQLYPGFSYNTTNYYIGVDNSVSSVTVQPMLMDTNATAVLNGQPLTNLQPSSVLSLNEGLNRLELTVTATDQQSRQVYGFDFYRAAAGASSDCNLSGLVCSPSNISFDSATLTYNVTVGWQNETFTMTPTASDSGAVIFFDGRRISSGSAQTVNPLPYGVSSGSFTVVAADFTAKTYTVNITREKAAIMNLYITEWADAGSDLDYIELRNFGSSPLTIDEDLRLIFGASTTTTGLTKWGTNNTEGVWKPLSSTPAVVQPGEVVLVVDSDLFNTTDGTANFDQLVTWGMPAGTKVFLSEESTLIGGNDRLDEGQAHLEWGSAKWGYTPDTAIFATNVGTSTYSALKAGFDPAVNDSSDTAYWQNGSTALRTPGTW